MKPGSPSETVEFDQFAACYDEALALGLAATGEDREYFARGRIRWLKDCLDRLRIRPASAIEFGCGTGSNVPLMIELIGAKLVTGLDISEKSLESANRSFGSGQARFESLSEYRPTGEIELAFCNGVFHHIAPAQRAAAIGYIRRCLRPGGLFAMWENNPLNPGTRYVMSRIPFDEKAITLRAGEGRRLLRAGGFTIVSTSFLFIFPRPLRRMRFLEPSLSRLPFGGQYQVLARRAD